jgi:hypothetical protein
MDRATAGPVLGTALPAKDAEIPMKGYPAALR